MTATPEPTVPLEDCIWLQRRPCGCVVAAVVAVAGGEWTLATAEEAHRHLNPTEWDRERAERAGLVTEPVTSARYRSEFRDSWRCTEHLANA